MEIKERISFEEAVTTKVLLKPLFDKLSRPQQVALKAFYGMDLKGEDLQIWSMLQGGVAFDEIGYPLWESNIQVPYTPKEYDIFVGVVGRRAGKTDKLGSTIMAYEAVFGGHSEYVTKGQKFIALSVAQKLDVAKANLPFIRAALEMSPIGSKFIEQVNAENIQLKNGLTILAASPSMKNLRGFAIPLVQFDEVGFWYSDPEAANPDIEVDRAVAYGQAQFPHGKKWLISTPWTKEGLLWRYFNGGTDGRFVKDEDAKKEFKGVYVIHAPTAALANPRIKREFLERLHVQDRDAFERESLARFVDSISGFLPTVQVRGACGEDYERAPVAHDSQGPRPTYVAAIDPAFRHDSFAFTIVHREADCVVQDVVKRWTPTKGMPLNPANVLAEIRPYLEAYNIKVLYSDQYQLESLQQIALGMGVSIEGIDFTTKSKVKIFGNLSMLFNQGKMKLLSNIKNHAAAVMVDELVRLEKRNLQQGGIAISAPEGAHDDMACVLALAVFRCTWLMPDISHIKPVEKEKTIFELGMATIKKRKLEALGEFD
jgi:hypothetical protein